jgi:hypothetical protein
MTEERKKKLNEENMSKFGNVSIGIHGKDLPQFTDKNYSSDMKEWWKLQRGFVQSPSYQSAKLLRQDSKLSGR